MDFASHGFEPLVVVGRQSLVTLLLQLLELRFDRVSVNPFGVMVSEHINVESLADRGDQMLLVELRVPLHRVVFDAGGDITQLSYGHVSQFFVGVLSNDSTILSYSQLASLA